MTYQLEDYLKEMADFEPEYSPYSEEDLDSPIPDILTGRCPDCNEEEDGMCWPNNTEDYEQSVAAMQERHKARKPECTRALKISRW